jgi:3-phenylpropionate/trans-cinnamate dioxygenase ferredoxin component
MMAAQDLTQPTDLSTVRMCAAKEIPKGGGKSFKIGTYELAVFNTEGQYFASANICSHAHEPLSEGWLEGTRIECPRHGAQFCLKTGEAKTLPATQPIEVFPIEIRGEDLYVTLPTRYTQ